MLLKPYFIEVSATKDLFGIPPPNLFGTLSVITFALTEKLIFGIMLNFSFVFFEFRGFGLCFLIGKDKPTKIPPPKKNKKKNRN